MARQINRMRVFVAWGDDESPDLDKQFDEMVTLRESESLIKAIGRHSEKVRERRKEEVAGLERYAAYPK